MTPIIYKLLIGILVTGSVVGSGLGIWKIVEHSKQPLTNENEPELKPEEQKTLNDSQEGSKEKIPINADTNKRKISVITKKNSEENTKATVSNNDNIYLDTPLHINFDTEKINAELSKEVTAKTSEIDVAQKQQYVIASLKDVYGHDIGGNFCIIDDGTLHEFKCKIFELSDELKTIYETLYSSKNINDEKWTQIDKELKELTTNKASEWVKTDKLYKFIFIEKIKGTGNFTSIKDFSVKLATEENINKYTKTTTLEGRITFETNYSAISEENKICFRNPDKNSTPKSFCQK